jgi:alcohol dehydrogenase (cytochrome c)
MCGLAAATPGYAAGPTQKELDQSGQATDSWLMTNKSYDGHRYVNLRQINAGNAAALTEVCTFDSGVAAPAQSTPVLYDGRIYLSVGQTTIAIDANNCKQIWRYEWVLKGKALSNPNRGVAIKDGRLVRGTSDGYLIALDMADGKLLWDRQIASYEQSQYLSMPAMIVGDTIIYGTAGADWGSRGWIGAFKLRNGEELWRFYALPSPGEPGAETWAPEDALAHGGGSFWTPVSVDRAKHLVYVPVGNPAPDFFGGVRMGDNLYTDSLVALDIKTGKPAWSKQFVPHDTHDWDLSQVSPLVRASIKGRRRNLIVVSGKDGHLRIVDRDSHDVLYDLAIVRQENADQPVTAEGVHVCPGLLGGQEWSSSAYDPLRNITISPMVDWCGVTRQDPTAPAYQVGVHYYAGKTTQDPIEQGRGVLAAVDVSSGTVRWRMEAPAPLLSNVTPTAGGVVFAADLKGTLYVVNSDDGTVVLRHSIGASAGGGLFTYELHGKQYVAALSGSVSAFFGGAGNARLLVMALP